MQPLVGQKKAGDFTATAVLTAYRALIRDFLPAHRVVLGVLSTAMRYAGPREAVFHAIIRRNYGCTHFVVGRDHAGVGKYYGKYAAQELARVVQLVGQTQVKKAPSRGLAPAREREHPVHSVGAQFKIDLVAMSSFV